MGQDTTLKKMVGKVGGLEYITDNCCGIEYNEYRGYVCVYDCNISSLLFSICLLNTISTNYLSLFYMSLMTEMF